MRVLTTISKRFLSMGVFLRRNKSVTVNSLFLSEIERCTINRRFGTARNYRHTLNSFMKFLVDDLSIAKLTPEIIIEYEKWLLLRGLNRNSTSFYMRNLRSIYNKALKSGDASRSDLFVGVYTSIDRTRKRALDEDAIFRLQKLDLRNNPALALARDLFLFSFFARGMAYVDVAFLKKSNIENDMITYIRRKTGQQLTVRLEPCIRTIIDRYRHITAGSVYVFPVLKSTDPLIAHQQYSNALNRHNDKLKILTKMIGESTIITSYSARHTWATTARRHRIPLSIISAGMGHASEKTTEIYLAPFENSDIDDANKTILDILNQ